jgi:NADH-quinone oxidoreductase subunit G
VNLLAGNSEHTSLAKSGGAVSKRKADSPASISPANDSLFSSGTLGRYSRALNSVIEAHEIKPAEVAAD